MANDWQTAMVPVFLRAHYMNVAKYQPIRTLFTIHNMEYQGRFPDEFVDEVLGLPEDWNVVKYDIGGHFRREIGGIGAEHVLILPLAGADELRHLHQPDEGGHPYRRPGEHRVPHLRV